MSDVYAAGDITTFPVKQGGIAAQQADAAAEAIAAAAGADVDPAPFQPVLRGLLLTGGEPRYLRSELAAGRDLVGEPEPLWWPPAKIVGRYLAPFLAGLAGAEGQPRAGVGFGRAVEVELDADAIESRRDRLLEVGSRRRHRRTGGATVGDVMSADPWSSRPRTRSARSPRRCASATSARPWSPTTGG